MSSAVEVFDLYSTWYEVNTDVPQASVLGLLLFLMFMNDLPQIVKSPCLIYADDLKLWWIIRDPDDWKQLQEELDAVDRWSE